MPIPELRQDLPAPSPSALRLLPAPIPRGRPAHALDHSLWFPRALAHGIDSLLILGTGFYFAQVSALFLAALQMKAIRATGREEGSVFQEVYEAGQNGLAPLGLFLAAIVFLVVLPHFSGRTPGLGVMGLRLEGEDGSRPELRALLRRLVACLLGYATFGVLLLSTPRGRDPRFLQDRVSHTRIVKDI